MVREFAVYFYLRLFSLFFTIFRLIPVQKKTVFVISFPESNEALYKEMIRRKVPCKTVLLTSGKHVDRLKSWGAETYLFELRHINEFVRSIYHLATASVVFVDNYFGFLAAANFSHNTACIQLWHANGAIKKFGLEDQGNRHRTKKAIERFKKVYNNFTYIVAGSEPMSEIFQKAFGLPEERVLKTGLPRTDVFFDEIHMKSVVKKLHDRHPFLAGKKVLLYAPTYRDNELATFELKLDLELLKKSLEDNYVLLLKLHPAVRNSLSIPNSVKDFAFDFSAYPDINDLLFITDILITDYSSIPFEFSILGRNMIFFPYDLREYEAERGFWFDYEKNVPGPAVYSTKEIVDEILAGQVYSDRVRSFNSLWNQYSTGNSSHQVASFVTELLARGLARSRE